MSAKVSNKIVPGLDYAKVINKQQKFSNKTCLVNLSLAYFRQMFSLPIPSEKSVSTVKMLGWLNILVSFWLCLKARLQGSNYVDLQWSSTIWPERHFQSNSVGIEYHNDTALERHLQWNSKKKMKQKGIKPKSV